MLLINTNIMCSEGTCIIEQPREVLIPICLAGSGLVCISCAPQCGVCCAACTAQKTLCAGVMESAGSGLFCCSLGCLLANCQESK